MGLRRPVSRACEGPHTWLAFSGFLESRKRLPMRAHTPPRPHHPHRPHHTTLACVSSPLPTPGLHLLGASRVFKGATPPRALTTPTAHTPSHPGLATTHTWLVFREYLKVANACPHPPTPSPPPPPTPHPTPASPLPGAGCIF